MPVGTRLGEFEIRRVLGVGGFGIVYLAFDHLLEREVALKEYMPATLVDRNETLHVSLVSQEHADTFALGLRSFVNEARLLARFDHPSLVKVHRFWEANGTAYMAMALYKGRNARDVRAKLGTPADEAWVRSMVEPLLGAIERLHSEDVYHRDIAPDNIMIEPDGRPVLLDFGAARRVITDRSQALTAILKPSYAPIEQYADVSGMKQGPWTDIYALGATMHFLLLGKPPPPAPGRSIQDTMKPLASQALPGCTPEFLAVIDWMLAPLPTERPQTVAAVRDALAGRSKASATKTPP
jgi:serine/threonine protein kinase